MVGEVIGHGDMIYLMPSLMATAAATQNSQSQSDFSKIEEDDVDIDLARQDGKIIRGRDDQL